MKVEIAQASIDHIPAIVPKVRHADAVELWDFARVTPAEAMYHSLNRSGFARTGFVDDEAVCMFGLSTLSVAADTGRVWMVGTYLLDRYANTFLRRCMKEVEEMLVSYRRIENFVDVRNVRAIEWLKWLAFTMEGPQRLGPYNMEFIPFYKERQK